MGEKIVVSKPGINVGTATDANDLIFSSDYQTLRYDTSGTVGLSYNPNANPYNEYSTFISHNLGYKPFFVAFVDPTGAGNFYALPYINQAIASMNNFWVFSGNAQLFFLVESFNAIAGTATSTAVFKYFIFKNDTNL